jgi:hypothetical protein
VQCTPLFLFSRPAFKKDFKVDHIDCAGLIEVRTITIIIARIAVIIQPMLQEKQKVIQRRPTDKIAAGFARLNADNSFLTDAPDVLRAVSPTKSQPASRTFRLHLAGALARTALIVGLVWVS